MRITLRLWKKVSINSSRYSLCIYAYNFPVYMIWHQHVIHEFTWYLSTARSSDLTQLVGPGLKTCQFHLSHKVLHVESSDFDRMTRRTMMRWLRRWWTRPDPADTGEYISHAMAWKHSPHWWPFVRRIHWSAVVPPHGDDMQNSDLRISSPRQPPCDLTQWGRVTHICVSNQTIIGFDNGLSPGRRQAII